MKPLSEHTYHARNAWGGYTKLTEERFEVELADVGKTRQNYQGCGYSRHTFTAADVGRTVINYKSGYWSNWMFGLVSNPVPAVSPDYHVSPTPPQGAFHGN